MSNQSINKYLYKVFLIVTKYTPITLSVLFVINLFCNYYKVSMPILSYLGGVSFIFLALLYLMSWVFQFCHLYRIPLYYITIGNIIGLLNYWFDYPVRAVAMARIYCILTGVMIFIYIWLVYKNRNKPKVDRIKQLCDSFCDCT